jgi:hypothetical protein
MNPVQAVVSSADYFLTAVALPDTSLTLISLYARKLSKNIMDGVCNSQSKK